MTPRYLRSENVVFPDEMRPATIRVEDGYIKEVLPYDFEEEDGSIKTIDYGRCLIFPGLVDAHVHVNEPGNDSWEGFETATVAAASGGITTIVDMPLNSSPVTTTEKALRAKLQAMDGKLAIDCGLYGGLVPGNLEHLKALIHSGVMGVKAFLISSGFDEFKEVGQRELRAAMPFLASHKIPLLVHCEIENEDHLKKQPLSSRSQQHEMWRKSRPASMELDAIRFIIQLAEEYRCPVHIVHLGTSKAAAFLKRARDRNIPVTVETAPHYLFFDKRHIERGDTRFKCAPPIRGKKNRMGLWQMIINGEIDMVASDHSPCPPELKVKEFAKAWGGIAGLQYSLPVMYTEGERHGLKETDIARLLSEAPAMFLGQSHRIGSIEEGKEASFAIYDPKEVGANWPMNCLHRHKNNAYIQSAALRGRVIETWLRGEKIWSADIFRMNKIGLNGPRRGRFVKRNEESS